MFALSRQVVCNIQCSAIHKIVESLRHESQNRKNRRIAFDFKNRTFAIIKIARDFKNRTFAIIRIAHDSKNRNTCDFAILKNRKTKCAILRFVRIARIAKRPILRFLRIAKRRISFLKAVTVFICDACIFAKKRI